MKKLKSILCGALAFVAGSLVLSACGVKTNPNENPTQQEEQQQQETAVGTKTTISLAEAKRIIVNALAIDNNQLQTQSTRGMVLHAADVSEGNRDIFEKMGNFTFDERDYDNEVNDPMNENGLHHFTGQATYNGHEFKTALIKDGNGQEVYCSNSESLYFTGDVATIKAERGYGVASNFIMYQMYQSLFADEAFDSVYDDTATKEINKDGYSITLTGDFEKWMSYLGSSVEECDVNYFNVTVNVDGNNDVISAIVEFQIKSIENNQHRICTSLMTFTKTNEPITEPDWVAKYKNA